MLDYQTTANEIGSALRAAEQSVQSGNLGQAVADLGTLHAKLGQGFLAANAVLDAAGMAPLDWNAVAGNPAARGGGQTNSGGGNKGEPAAQE